MPSRRVMDGAQPRILFDSACCRCSAAILHLYGSAEVVDSASSLIPAMFFHNVDELIDGDQFVGAQG